MGKKDGILLAALPSGGSDFVADCICKAAPHLKYAREYFCPIINWRRCHLLETLLGDTCFANALKLCQPVTADQLSRLLDATWRQDGFTFAKENYIPWQLSAFAQTFECVVLVRSFSATFPPHRHRVTQWYEHFHGALLAAGKLDEFCQVNSRTPMHRAAIGHYWFARKLCEVARGNNLPLLWYDDLVSKSPMELIYELPQLPFDRVGFADAIAVARQTIDRPGGEYQDQWQSAGELYRHLETMYGHLKD